MTRHVAKGDRIRVCRWNVRAVVTAVVQWDAVRVLWWESPAPGSAPVTGVAAWYDGQPAPVVPLTPGVAA